MKNGSIIFYIFSTFLVAFTPLKCTISIIDVLKIC